ncbi:GPI transamidase subunit PIG-U isoform 2 [Hibiscus syriacus]|uniref:GPI transamidase subunit PIG-U isoform 2 n=1 Tax=Hibiscus syriacus TaxID=106335 RepID=A0A6A2Y5E6_HIBSY|nr:GPI transamidase subunit PIG-U isoform 2 [Hibiscus syriacus]
MSFKEDKDADFFLLQPLIDFLNLYSLTKYNKHSLLSLPPLQFLHKQNLIHHSQPSKTLLVPYWSIQGGRHLCRFNHPLFLLLFNLRKGKRTCTTKHPSYLFMTYKHLSPNHKAFLTSLNTTTITKTIFEALENENWKKAMKEEMDALEKNKTWDLVKLPNGKKTVGQFDNKNALLHGDLEKEVYMDIPPGFGPSTGQTVCRLKKALYGQKQSLRVWFVRFVKVTLKQGFKQSQGDYTLFVKHSSSGGSDCTLGEIGKLGCKLAESSIEVNHKLGNLRDDDATVDRSSFQRLVDGLWLIPLAAFGWVIATHLSLYPAILIIPVIFLLGRGPDAPPWKLFLQRHQQNGMLNQSKLPPGFSWGPIIRFAFWSLVWSVYVLVLCGISLKQFGGLWEMFKSTYGFILTVEDLSPNIGVLWLEIQHCTWVCWVDMQFSLFLFCGYVGVSLLSPVMHNLWIWRGTGNANFYFATAMVYACLQIVLVVEGVSAMLNHERKLRRLITGKTQDSKSGLLSDSSP